MKKLCPGTTYLLVIIKMNLKRSKPIIVEGITIQIRIQDFRDSFKSLNLPSTRVEIMWLV